MSSPNRWFLLVVVSSILAVLATIAGTGDALAMVPVLWFLAVIPGLPYVRMLRNDHDPLALWLTAGGLSVALAALVAEVLLYTDSYTALRAVSVLAGIACLGAVIGRLRASTGDPEPAEPVGAELGD